jgi:hypothetical protein
MNVSVWGKIQRSGPGTGVEPASAYLMVTQSAWRMFDSLASLHGVVFHAYPEVCKQWAYVVRFRASVDGVGVH